MVEEVLPVLGQKGQPSRGEEVQDGGGWGRCGMITAKVEGKQGLGGQVVGIEEVVDYLIGKQGDMASGVRDDTKT